METRAAKGAPVGGRPGGRPARRRLDAAAASAVGALLRRARRVRAPLLGRHLADLQRALLELSSDLSQLALAFVALAILCGLHRSIDDSGRATESTVLLPTLARREDP